jgi:UDP-N-acetylmuramoyl-tripeptide--D-alanyl-D-alanine ligase
MRPIALSEFARLCGGTLYGEDAPILGFATDHRQARPGDLFLAIKGAKVDGHDFAAQAVEAGAVGVIAERPLDVRHVRVTNLVEALAAFALARRSAFKGHVVGITGSNGKTTTKEFTAAAVAPLGPTLKNPSSQNTEYTSPLLWAQAGDQAAVVAELAMRGFGQIAHLCSFTRPTVGVITMIGTAHIEMVGSREGIARSKSEILTGTEEGGAAILWAEDDFLSFLRTQARGPARTFGEGPDAELRVLGYRALDWRRCVVRFGLAGATAEVELPTVGRHQARNAAAALLVADTLGVPLERAAEAMTRAELPPMRMEGVPLRGATVLMDAYNASPDSTVAAMRTLSELPCQGRRIAVLGEMLELGAFAESGHRRVGRVLAESPIDFALLVGELVAHIEDEAVRAGYPESKLRRASGIEDVAGLLRSVGPGDVVLLKGSRALGLERALEEVAE